MPAVAAGHLAGDAVEVQDGVFSHCARCDDIPIELDRVIHDGGELTDHEVDIRHAAGIRFLGVAEGNIEDGLGNREFVHFY